MKIEFEDKSYIELSFGNNEVTIILCGVKGRNQLTMSSATLSKAQALEVLTFFKQFENISK
jgi:hypothetical protein